MNRTQDKPQGLFRWIRHPVVREYAEAGVERISIGALTHSAPSLDIALDIVS